MPLAVGVLGLTPADLEVLSLMDIKRAIIARQAYDQQRDRAVWESSRIQAYFTLAPYFKKGSKQTPSGLFKLPWDNGKGNSSISHADRVAAFLKAKKTEEE